MVWGVCVGCMGQVGMYMYIEMCTGTCSLTQSSSGGFSLSLSSFRNFICIGSSTSEGYLLQLREERERGGGGGEEGEGRRRRRRRKG